MKKSLKNRIWELVCLGIKVLTFETDLYIVVQKAKSRCPKTKSEF